MNLWQVNGIARSACSFDLSENLNYCNKNDIKSKVNFVVYSLDNLRLKKTIQFFNWMAEY